MHHGDVIVRKPFRDAMLDVTGWAAKNQTELVIAYITDCDGDGCEGEFLVSASGPINAFFQPSLRLTSKLSSLCMVPRALFFCLPLFDPCALCISLFRGRASLSDAVASVFRNLSIPFVQDCSKLANMTEQDARAFAHLPTGGLVMGVFGCMDEQYDPSVECYTSTE